eukprot:338761-Amphidinium_carterae.1
MSCLRSGKRHVVGDHVGCKEQTLSSKHKPGEKNGKLHDLTPRQRPQCCVWGHRKRFGDDQGLQRRKLNPVSSRTFHRVLQVHYALHATLRLMLAGAASGERMVDSWMDKISEEDVQMRFKR